MKCPRCNADSEVLATREFSEVLLRRFRQCFNGHRFQSFEVFRGNLDARTIAATARGAVGRAAAQKRRAAVLARPHASATELARMLGCSEARVRQIRSEQSQ